MALGQQAEAGRAFRKIFTDQVAQLRAPQLRPLLWCVAFCNGLIIAASLWSSYMRATGAVTDRHLDWLSVAYDYSPAELLGYVQMIAAIALLLRSYRASQNNCIAYCIAIISYLCLDDMLMIHDQLRDVLGPILFPAVDAAKQASNAEAVYATVVLVPVLYGLYRVCRHARAAEFMAVLPVLGSIGLFGFFAAFLDQLHQLIEDYRLLPMAYVKMAGLIEDGGEMLATALMLVTAVALFRSISRNDILLPADSQQA